MAPVRTQPKADMGATNGRERPLRVPAPPMVANSCTPVSQALGTLRVRQQKCKSATNHEKVWGLRQSRLRNGPDRHPRSRGPARGRQKRTPSVLRLTLGVNERQGHPQRRGAPARQDFIARRRLHSGGGRRRTKGKGLLSVEAAAARRDSS